METTTRAEAKVSARNLASQSRYPTSAGLQEKSHLSTTNDLCSEMNAKRNFSRAIERFHKANPLLAYLKAGASPEQFKQLVVSTLEPYFENKQFVHDHGIDSLVEEAANVGRIQLDQSAELWLRQLLEIHRNARKVNMLLCLQTLGQWEAEIVHGRNEFWSVVFLEADLSNLSLEDFKYEVFRTIGMIIEACLQPLLKALLAQVRLASGNLKPNNGLMDRELGKIIDELFAKLPDHELVAPGPWNIRLSQWRNMAQHHKTRVQGDTIFGVYGVGVKQTEVVLSRVEVLQFVDRLNLVLGAVRGARAIFLFDNLDGIAPYMPNVAGREEAKVFHLAAPFSTQGFLIEDLKDGDNSVLVRIRDATEGNVVHRMAHCSQFFFAIWQHFPRELVVIDFIDSAGIHKARMSTKGADLARYQAGEIGEERLATAVRFERPPSQESASEI